MFGFSVKGLAEELAQTIDSAYQLLLEGSEWLHNSKAQCKKLKDKAPGTMLLLNRLIHWFPWSCSLLTGVLCLIKVVVWENTWDWTRILLDGVGLRMLYYRTFESGDITLADHPVDRTVFAVWVMWRWLQLLDCLRGMYAFGPSVLPILEAIKRVTNFIMILVVMLLAFTNAYYVFNVRDDPPHPWIAAAFMILRLGVFVDFDLFEMEGTDPILLPIKGNLHPQDPTPTDMWYSVRLLFGLVAFFVGVLMMNVFIGILGSNYDRFEDIGVGMFTKYRAQVLVMYSSRWWLRWFPFNRFGEVPTNGQAGQQELQEREEADANNRASSRRRASLRQAWMCVFRSAAGVSRCFSRCWWGMFACCLGEARQQAVHDKIVFLCAHEPQPTTGRLVYAARKQGLSDDSTVSMRNYIKEEMKDSRAESRKDLLAIEVQIADVAAAVQRLASAQTQKASTSTESAGAEWLSQMASTPGSPTNRLNKGAAYLALRKSRSMTRERNDKAW
uniref:Ion transport domain-containing protein n=1 Tax=Zooxanthella nutricula TaxID=1333877 RepID=A0A7S2L4C8_9DINO